jgi:hypothetical protein
VRRTSSITERARSGGASTGPRSRSSRAISFVGVGFVGHGSRSSWSCSASLARARYRRDFTVPAGQAQRLAGVLHRQAQHVAGNRHSPEVGLEGGQGRVEIEPAVELGLDRGSRHLVVGVACRLRRSSTS